MLRRMADYGLKEFHDFREIHIPTTYDIPDVHDKMTKHISPTITDLEASTLINSFHFILHEDIDLRLSTEDWRENEEKIKGILRKHGLPDELQSWSLMPPENYGGDTGVTLSYNQLEFNSRLIMALLDAEKTDDIATKADLRRYGYNLLVCTQWVHHLYAQYGMRNDAQVLLEFADSLGWLRELISNNPQDMEVRDFANRALHSMRRDVTQFMQKLQI